MIGLLMLAATLPATHSRYDLRGATIYSNLCVDRQTDDVNGVRVFIRRTDPRVLVQVAEGGLEAPEVAAAHYRAGRLMFELHSDAPSDRLSGKMTGDTLFVRTYEHGAEWFRLPKRESDRAPYCR